MVAPNNEIITTSIGMEVYNSPLKFQIDCICISQDIAFLNCGFPIYFVLWWAGCAHHNTNVSENHDNKNVISHDLHVQSLFKFLRTIVDLHTYRCYNSQVARSNNYTCG